MQSSNIPRLAILAAGTFAIHVHAQEQQTAGQMDEIVITSSRIPQPLRHIGTSMSVITTAEIDAHGNLAITDILRQLPAISTTGNGGAGKPISLRIRGEEGYRTLTIIDGLRLLDPGTTQVGPQFEHLLSDGVSRVEILRGPQGLSYGADAGGIVNLSTAHVDDGLHVNLDAQGGRFDTQQYGANLAGGNTHGNFFVSLTDLQTAGFNSRAADDVLMDADGYANTTIHAGGSIRISETLNADIVHRTTDGDSQFDGCFDATFAFIHTCEDQYDSQASRIALTFDDARFQHAIAFSTTKTERENFAAATPTFASAGELKRFEYLGTATALPGFDLVFGGDVEEAVNNETGRDNKGVFLEYLSDHSASFFVTAGIRYDNNDDFGANTSYRVSAAYLIDTDNDATWKLKSSYGTGLRAPSPYEIAYNAGSFSYPPAALVTLNQEQSKGFEAGLEYWRGASLHLEAVYFDQQVHDAIYFDLDTFSGYLQDTGKSTSRGVELSGVYTLNPHWRFNANYTYNPTERPNGQPRLRRPEQLTNIGVAYSALTDRLGINAFYRISRDSVDESNAALVGLDDFAVLDLSASFGINDFVQVYARVENVLDENYQEVAGYNTAGRAAYVGIRMNYAGP